MFARTLLRFSCSRKILLYSLFLSDVSLENRPYRFFLRGSNDYDVNHDASKFVTLVCNHTDIASI